MLNDTGEIWFSTDKYQVWKNIHKPKEFRLEEYFPSEVKRKIIGLKRKGCVKVEEKERKWEIELTDLGRMELMKINLNKYQVKKDRWDGRWRVVFFDVGEEERKARDRFRYFLKRLGFKQLQRSLWVCPYDVIDAIEEVRELLNIKYDVRWAIMTEIENEESLKRWFRV